MPRKAWNDDAYTRKAQREGYAARSAYKLLEIQERKRIIRPGDRVLDLGCAPGAWLQVAEQLVGDHGAVVGVDLQPVRIALGPNVRTIVGDIYKADPTDLRADGHASSRLFDVLLSDMAPSTGGGAGGSADHFASVHLCERVLDLAPALLRPGGCLAMKVFEGEAYPDLLARASAMFAKAKGFKPKASRGASREMYIVAEGFRAGGGKTLTDNKIYP